MRMTERGQVTIPKSYREKFGFRPDREVEFHEVNGALVIRPKFDREKFDAAIKKFRGQSTARLREMGFNSTDEYIEAIRGR